MNNWTVEEVQRFNVSDLGKLIIEKDNCQLCRQGMEFEGKRVYGRCGNCEIRNEKIMEIWLQLQAERATAIQAREDMRNQCIEIQAKLEAAHTAKENELMHLRQAHAQEVEDLKDKLEEAEKYADKLVQGLPEGMLPKDVELLREANADMATQLDQCRPWLRLMRRAIQEDLIVFVEQEEHLAKLEALLAKITPEEEKENP